MYCVAGSAGDPDSERPAGDPAGSGRHRPDATAGRIWKQPRPDHPHSESAAGQYLGLDVTYYFDLVMSNLPCTCFDASRREKHDGV